MRIREQYELWHPCGEESNSCITIVDISNYRLTFFQSTREQILEDSASMVSPLQVTDYALVG